MQQWDGFTCDCTMTSYGGPVCNDRECLGGLRALGEVWALSQPEGCWGGGQGSEGCVAASFSFLLTMRAQGELLTTAPSWSLFSWACVGLLLPEYLGPSVDGWPLLFILRWLDTIPFTHNQRRHPLLLSLWESGDGLTCSSHIHRTAQGRGCVHLHPFFGARQSMWKPGILCPE